MRPKYAVFIIVVAPFVQPVVLPSEAGSFFDDVGKAIEKGVQDAGNAIEKGAHDAGNAIEKGAHDAGNAIEKGAHDAGNAIEKGAHDAGNAIEKGAHDAGNAIEKGAHDSGRAIEKGFNDTVAEVERFVKRVCEDWLNIPDGECYACYTSEDDGQVYACEEGDPDRGTPPSRYEKEDEDRPTKEQLDEMEQWKKSTEITHEELEPKTDGLSEFLPSKEIKGSPLPSDTNIVSPTGSDEIRGKDGYGAGFFLAPRALIGSNEAAAGVRYHAGLDFVASPSQEVVSPVNGEVIRISNVYVRNNKGLKAVVIRRRGYEFKVLYADPAVKEGDKVLRGMPIGKAQDLSEKFGDKMTNHVHMSIIDPQGRRVDPGGKWAIKKRRD